MGTALIVLSWTLFANLGMNLVFQIILTVIGAIIAFFGLLFVVYFFNLDMKATSALKPLLQVIYNKRKRDRRI